MENRNEFPKLPLKKFAQIQERETPESLYWRRYKVTKEERLYGVPHHIHFNSAQIGLGGGVGGGGGMDEDDDRLRDSNDAIKKKNSKKYLVSASTKISLFDSATDKVIRSFSRFTDEAFSGRFRRDGKLIVAGDKAGFIKVFDVKTKSCLRNIKGHNSAVRATAWTLDNLFMVSGSDDYSVKRWDLGTEDCVFDSSKLGSTGSVHTDYVRVIESHPTMSQIFMSASYDHTIKVWDSRMGTVAFSLDHELPVECGIVNRSGSMLISGGGSEVKIWDLLSGGRLLHTFNNHQKNVTGLCFDGSGSKLLTCSLDSHVKVFNLQTLQLLHGMKYDSPLVSIAVSPDDRKLIVGQADGNLCIRTRSDGSTDSAVEMAGSGSSASSSSSEKDDSLAARQDKFYKASGTRSALHSNSNSLENSNTSNTLDGYLETERSVRLKPYEQHLKKFNYQLALDSAMKTRNPLIVVTVLEELCRRSGLTIALSGRDEKSLEPLLSFASKHVSHPRYSRLIVQVVDRILDLYGGMLGQSDAIDELFVKLQNHIKGEISFQRQVIKVMGALDGVISAAILSTGV